LAQTKANGRSVKSDDFTDLHKLFKRIQEVTWKSLHTCRDGFAATGGSFTESSTLKLNIIPL